MSRNQRRKPRGRASHRRGNAPARSVARRVLWAAGAVALLVIVIAIAATEGNRSPVEARNTRDPAIVAAGAELYTASCATCHGPELQGTATGPPLLHQIYAPNHHADEAFQRAVAGGVQPHHWDFGPMAPVPGLSRDQVAMIVEFVRAEQEAAGIFRDPMHR